MSAYTRTICIRSMKIWALDFGLYRLRDWGQPFLAFHPGLVRDALAYHGCAELFQVSC